MHRDSGGQGRFLETSVPHVAAHNRRSRPEFNPSLVLSADRSHPHVKTITPDFPLFRQAAQIQNIVCLL